MGSDETYTIRVSVVAATQYLRRCARIDYRAHSRIYCRNISFSVFHVEPGLTEGRVNRETLQPYERDLELLATARQDGFRRAARAVPVQTGCIGFVVIE
jgi:hypothetical protein